MSDGKKFRGRLMRFDNEALVLEEVYELSDRLQWVLPVIYTTLMKKGSQPPDIVEETDRGYLNHVIINNRHIIRIWPWEPIKLI